MFRAGSPRENGRWECAACSVQTDTVAGHGTRFLKVYVVIMGCGRVGSSLARALIRVGHEVTVIDRDPSAFRRLGENFTGQEVIGVGFDRDVLTRAGIERADAFASGRLAKHTVLSKDRAGFIVNALLIPYLLAAIRMVESGFASPEDIDTGMVDGCAHPLRQGVAIHRHAFLLGVHHADQVVRPWQAPGVRGQKTISAALHACAPRRTLEQPDGASYGWATRD